jgi:hypothetical protein
LKAKEFCCWLNGFFQISDKSEGLNKEQVEVIKAHLKMAFYHDIDPSYPDHEKLTEIHENGKNKVDSPKKVSGKTLSKYLLDLGKIDNDYYSLIRSRKNGISEYDFINDNKIIDEDILIEAYSKIYYLESIDLISNSSLSNVTEIISNYNLLKKSNNNTNKYLVEKYSVLFFGENDNKLKVITYDPSNLDMLDNIRFRMRKELELFLAKKSDILKVIKNIYGSNEVEDTYDDNNYGGNNYDIGSSDVMIKC